MKVEFDLVLVCACALQLAMRGPSGPMGLTGRSGPVVSLLFLCVWWFVRIWLLTFFVHISRACLLFILSYVHMIIKVVISTQDIYSDQYYDYDY